MIRSLVRSSRSLLRPAATSVVSTSHVTSTAVSLPFMRSPASIRSFGGASSHGHGASSTSSTSISGTGFPIPEGAFLPPVDDTLYAPSTTKRLAIRAPLPSNLLRADEDPDYFYPLLVDTQPG
jgi:hypothetical protein